jgi:hypothetical protein
MQQLTTETQSGSRSVEKNQWTRKEVTRHWGRVFWNPLLRWILTEKAVICSPLTVFLCVSVLNRFQEKG